ncbi:MAG: PspC domain-containing protein [Ekhidna sp.]
MKKNISINIGGIIFHIEEDGYDKLKSYLDSVNKYFSSFEDSKEIIEDIEGRIAELFLAKLDEGKQVINHEDVDDLVATMGTTKDFEASIETEPAEPQSRKKEEENETEEDASEEKQSNSSQSSTSESKKFYRDEKRKVIGGVASGMANYFSVDPIWVRLLMLAFLLNIFFWGLSSVIFVAYIVLWIAVPASSQLEEDKKVKKLFRSTEDKVLGGVSGGIASYFGADPVLIRVLFVLSIFLGGAGLVAYIILWIISPEAKTITEKMQMQGEPVTISNIEENVKKSLNVKEGEENVFVKILLFPFRLIALIFNAIGSALGPLLKFAVEGLRVLVGVFFVCLGFIMMVAFTISLTVLLGVGGTLESLVHFGDFPAEQLVNSTSTIALVSAYLTSVIPSLGVALLGLVIILKKRVTSAAVGWSLFGLWLLGMIGLAFSIPAIVKDYSAEGTVRKEVRFDAQEEVVTLRLNDLDMDAFEKTDLRLRGHEDSTYLLSLEYTSRGFSRSNAKENAEAVSYKVEKNGTDFYFDSDLDFNEAPFRFQEVDATFYLPYGQVFRMDYDLRKILINSLWMYDYRASQMDGNDWVFDENGLNCLTCENDRSDREYSSSYRKRNGKDQKTYAFQEFDEVKLISLFDFEIIQGDDYSVELQGDEDELDEVYLEQSGDELEIRYKNDWKWWRKKNIDKIKIFIEMPELEYLLVRGACVGELKGFESEDMRLEIEGASDVTAEIFPQYLELEIAGASELTLIGDAEDLEANIVGASQLYAFEFPTNVVDVKAIGASTAKVYANNELKANAVGASTVRYRGSAQLNSSSAGLSSVKKD